MDLAQNVSCLHGFMDILLHHDVVDADLIYSILELDRMIGFVVVE